MSEKQGNTTNLTPQQQNFLAYYLDPKSDTYSNAYKSAVKSGYAEEFALNITGQMPKWLSESLGKRQKMLMKAERNLNNLLELDIKDKEQAKIVQDTSKFIAERIGKKHYSTKTESDVKVSGTLSLTDLFNGSN